MVKNNNKMFIDKSLHDKLKPYGLQSVFTSSALECYKILNDYFEEETKVKSLAEKIKVSPSDKRKSQCIYVDSDTMYVLNDKPISKLLQYLNEDNHVVSALKSAPMSLCGYQPYLTLEEMKKECIKMILNSQYVTLKLRGGEQVEKALFEVLNTQAKMLRNNQKIISDSMNTAMYLGMVYNFEATLKELKFAGLITKEQHYLIISELELEY